MADKYLNLTGVRELVSGMLPIWRILAPHIQLQLVNPYVHEDRQSTLLRPAFS